MNSYFVETEFDIVFLSLIISKYINWAKAVSVCGTDDNSTPPMVNAAPKNIGTNRQPL